MNDKYSELEKSFVVSRETWSRLHQYAKIVCKWQQSINLISAHTLENLWERHILDSLQIYHLNPEPQSWLDMGSGAGFPGLVTAICLAEKKSGWVYLIESNQKKAAFLRHVITQTEARASVHPIRINNSFDVVPEIDAISARALASLNDLLEMCEPWFIHCEKTSAWFHKGRDYAMEIELTHSRWAFNLIKYNSLIQNESVILQINDLKRL